MGTPIKIKRASVPGKVPTQNDLQLGELAIDTYNSYLFAERDAGVGIGTTIALLTPWVENFGAQSIYYRNSVGIGTTNATSKLTVTGDVRVSGVITATTFSGNINSGIGNITILSGSNVYYNTGIITSLTGIAVTYTSGTITNLVGSQASFSGVVTATSFSGNASSASYAIIAGYSTSSGIATYAVNAGIATYATIAGYSTSSGIATYAINAGIATYATSSGIATYAINAGVSTSVIGGIASVTQLRVSGITTLGVTTTTNLTVQQINVSGLSTFAGITTHTVSLFGTQASFSGVVTATSFSGNASSASYATSAGIATYATSSGIATYATSSGIATYATNAGISTYATSSGIATYATTAGIATYSTSAGIATALQNSRTFEITGDIIASPISFNGTGNVSLAATIQPNSVGLGTDTTGDYVTNITGTSNQITVSATSGEGSTPTLSIPNQFTAPQDVTVTRDLQVIRNLNVNGNITVGGTSAAIFTQELKIYDPDIVLGVRTDGSGNDISTDNTANHGGVAVASTEGTPLVQLFIAGIETNPTTYKKIMWFKEGAFSGLGTDAWLINYAVGIGSTQVPNGVRLAAGGMQVTDRTIITPNLNVSGIATVGFITASNLYVAGVGTFLSSGLKIRNPANTFGYTITGGAIAADRILNLPVITATDTIATLGLTQTFSAAQTFSSTLTHSATTTNLTASSYTTGNVTIGGASQTGTIILGQSTVSQILNIQAGISGVGTTKTINFGTGGSSGSFTNINIGPTAGVGTVSINSGTNLGIGSTRPTVKLDVIGDAKFTGVVTALSFSGNASSATYATNAGIATYSTNAGIATYSDNAGIATYATNAGIATYATTAGIATYSASSGIATYATNAGIATYATNAGIAGIATYATDAGIATYATNAGIATYSNSSGIATYATNAGIATYATDAGIATYATNAGIATYANNAGIATYSNSSGIATYATNAGIATYATNAGIATYATDAGIATYATNAGIATYSASSGIATYATNAGIATYATNAGIAGIATYATNAGISTYSNSSGIATYATNAGIATYSASSGIATYATNSGIATSVIGGIGSITRLQVTGISTFTNGPLLVGTGTSTGTASQPLQVTGGAYVSGNVGIGTTTNSSFPSSKLHVVGDVLVSGISRIYNNSSDQQSGSVNGTIGNSLLNIYSTTALSANAGGSISLGGVTDAASTVRRPFGVIKGYKENATADDFKGYLSFLTHNGSALSEALRINSSGNVLLNTTSATGTASQPLQVTGGAYVSGNVGIGTTNPGAPLEVVGSTSGDQLRINQSGQFYRIGREGSGGLLEFYGAQSGYNGYIFGGANGERLRIDSSGRLLVGTSSYDGNARAVIQGNTSSNTTGALAVRFNGTRPTSAGEGIGAIRFESTNNTSSNYHYASINCDTDGTSSSDTDIPGRLVFSTTADGAATPTERMRIDSAGNVEIGTSSPGVKLEVAGSARIGAADTSDALLVVGAGATGNRYSYIDLVADTTYTNYGLRIIRTNTGANTDSLITHKGTGGLYFICEEAGNIVFATDFTERARIDSSGRLLVGTSSSTNNIRLEQKLAIVNAGTGSYPGAQFTSYSGTDVGAAPLLELCRSRGTSDGTMTKVESGDRVGLIQFRGSDGSAFQDMALIDCYADGATGAGDTPGRLVFSTTADGAATPTEAMRIKSTRIINFSNAPTFADNTAATAGGLAVGDVYKTVLGVLMIRF